MFSRFNIGARLGIAFGVLFLLLVSAVMVGLHGLGALKNTASDALDTDAAIALNASQIQRLALQERRYEKDTFINIANAEKVLGYHQKWDSARRDLVLTLAEGEALTTNDAARSLYQQAQDALEGYASGFMEIYQQIQTGEITTTAQANNAFGRYKEEVYELESVANSINERARFQMTKASGLITDQHRNAASGLLGFAAIALILAIVLTFTITRSVVLPLRRALEITQRIANGDLRQDIHSNSQDETGQLLAAMGAMKTSLTTLVASLRHSSETVYIGANVISVDAQELSTRTEQQAVALQQTASSMEEMTATVRQNTENTEKANRLASDASRHVMSSASDVQQSIELMREIAVHSNQMNAIIETIDSIAFQTNILALNASVEAARAGSEGRGFAVVANEVRALASRSADSASQVRMLLEEVHTKISAGVQQADRSGNTISETETTIQQLATLMHEVAAANHEQIAGIEQINSAVMQIDSVTQQNASLVQASSTASSSLEEQAGHLKSLVATFQIKDDEATERSTNQTDLLLP